jgi:hypothetical protein
VRCEDLRNDFDPEMSDLSSKGLTELAFVGRVDLYRFS